MISLIQHQNIQTKIKTKKYLEISLIIFYNYDILLVFFL